MGEEVACGELLPPVQGRKAESGQGLPCRCFIQRTGHVGKFPQTCQKPAVELRAQAAKTMQDLGMNRWTDQSAAFIVVVEEKATLSATVGSKMKSQDYAQMDIGIATEHLCLAATAMGLSTCIIGWFDEKKLRALLGVPETKRIRLAVSVGYALEDRVREKKRKPASEIATFLE